MDTQIKLILLDFDGTLADTRLANARAYVATLAEAGYALTEQEYLEKYFGMRCNEFLTRFGITDPDERETLRLRKIALYPRFFDSVRLNRPLWEFCRAFRAQGGRVWIVSTGSRDNIDNAMRHLGISGPGTANPSSSDERLYTTDDLTRLFGQADAAHSEGRVLSGKDIDKMIEGLHAPHQTDDPAPSATLPAEGPNGAVDGILAGPDVTHSKPDPECFLEAMRREGVTPAETLIFEDSAVGLDAARRSGAAYIKVTL